MDLVYCPSCSQPAEVVWRRGLPSTHGPVEHAALRCLSQHFFVMRSEDLVPAVEITPASAS